jgi:hypothetical protein
MAMAILIVPILLIRLGSPRICEAVLMALRRYDRKSLPALPPPAREERAKLRRLPFNDWISNQVSSSSSLAVVIDDVSTAQKLPRRTRTAMLNQVQQRVFSKKFLRKLGISRQLDWILFCELDDNLVAPLGNMWHTPSAVTFAISFYDCIRSLDKIQ